MNTFTSARLRVTAHTEHVGLGTTFVAIPGQRYHGNDFVDQAITRGASRIVIERGSRDCEMRAASARRSGVPVDYVEHARAALATYAAHAYGNPQHKLSLVGVTGTKGKTTTAILTHHLLTWGDKRTAVISSAGKYIAGQRVYYPLTTPQPDFLYAFLYACCLHGVTHVVMEVAAQAVSLYRVAGMNFDTVIVTNFSHEHGEFYPDDAAYRAAKEQLLTYTHTKSQILLNADDATVRDFHVPHGTVTRFGFSRRADVQAQYLSQLHEPVRLRLRQWPAEVVSSLYGEGNAYNVLAATLAAHISGISWPALVSAHRYTPTIPGRMEEFHLYSGATACLDYAHNVASYRMVLAALRARFSCVWVVFGASGDRDAGKRAPMAAAASAYADVLVITSDNPRSEPVSDIVSDIQQGVDAAVSAYVIYDRHEAIRWACTHVPRDGVVAILGKGRDRGEIIGNQIYPHSDYMSIQACAP